MSTRVSTEEIVAAYRATGSIWAAGKRLGVSGQSVYDRLRALGWPLAHQRWSAAEDAELLLLVGNCTIGEIARRLGRPYAGVAARISRRGLAAKPAPRQKRIPRGAGWDRENTLRHMRQLERFPGKITIYARQRGLDVEMLARAIQRVDMDWWQSYVKARATGPPRRCDYCEVEFYPGSGKQIYCSRACQADARRDRAYFGGHRRETIGLAERQCQCCSRRVDKGLAAHHLIGKENDPSDGLLIALCAGCHQIIGVLAGRTFVDEEVGWENLINLVLLRRKGFKLGAAIETMVDIDWLSQAEVDERESGMTEEEQQTYITELWRAQQEELS